MMSVEVQTTSIYWATSGLCENWCVQNGALSLSLSDSCIYLVCGDFQKDV